MPLERVSHVYFYESESSKEIGWRLCDKRNLYTKGSKLGTDIHRYLQKRKRHV